MRLSLSLLVFLAAFAGACKASGPAPAKDEVSEALNQPGALILDVRSPAEFARSHVQGAVNVPVSEISRIEKILPEKDRQIVVHCAAGVRSAQASTALAEMGYTRVLDAKTPAAVAKAQGQSLVR